MTRSIATGFVASVLVLAAVPAVVAAHAPDPVISTVLWGRDQVATYQWNTSWPPPAWLATAFDAGAADSNASRNSRAAVYTRASSSNAVISYSGPTNCDWYGIACMDRTGMSVDGTFKVWFRPQGWAFDWGTLKWCQWYTTAPNGCYDAETTSLDELGHVEYLGHHVNFADGSDFTDAVVQYAGRQRPGVGWNQHVYGRCDVARLQLGYERRDPANLVSKCLSLASAITFTSSTDTVVYGGSVRFTATLKIATSTSAGAMSGDPLSDRPVLLQRRSVGGSTWSTVGTMAASTTNEGAYTFTIGPTATYDWRATFSTPSNEGLAGVTSGTLRIAVTTCTGGGCPLAATR